MPIASLPDVRIYYEWSGAEHLPVLMFCNGLGTNMHMWDAQLAALSEKFRVLRYDTRGHGQSEVTPGPYTIEQLSWDAVRLLDALQLDRVNFCGLSMGGLTGMFLGANASKRFHKLVLCSTAAKIGTDDTWNKRIETVERGGMKAVADTVLDRWFTSGFRSTHPNEVPTVRAMLESTDPRGYAANCAAVRDSDQRNTIGSIRIPCLVVVGKDDPGTPPRESQFLAKTIPGAACVELPGSHLCNIEARNEFNKNVLRFLLA
jgi:3-oxoadipate enol-lactonase